MEMFDESFLRQLVRFTGEGGGRAFQKCTETVRAIQRIGKRLLENDYNFKECLRRASKAVKDVERTEDADSVLRKVTSSNGKILNDAIDDIRRMISEANDLVNSIDLEDVQLPLDVIHTFEKYDDLLPKIGDRTVTYSLANLKLITTILENKGNDGSFYFVCRYRREIRALTVEIDCLKEGIEVFNEWIHDMGHYLVQIDKIMPSRNGNDIQMLESDIHRLDALLEGVRLLKIGLQTSLQNDDVMKSLVDKPLNENQKTHSCEPYKIFHKLRYCFSEKDIIWDDGQGMFWGKVIAAPGIEFVAMNLYSNAVKYLSRFPGERKIITRFTQLRDGLEIVMESYGPLVTDDELQKISYQSQYRGSSALGYKGTGRGLCRVRKICESAGYLFTVDMRRDNIMYGSFAPFVTRIFIPQKYQVS